MSDDRSSAAEWAYIFSTFGRENLRKLLYQVAYELRAGESDREVIEFSYGEDGPVALPITDHVDTLESDVSEHALDNSFAVTD